MANIPALVVRYAFFRFCERDLFKKITAANIAAATEDAGHPEGVELRSRSMTDNPMLTRADSRAAAAARKKNLSSKSLDAPPPISEEEEKGDA